MGNKSLDVAAVSGYGVIARFLGSTSSEVLSNGVRAVTVCR